jgi:hypothetical protein
VEEAAELLVVEQGLLAPIMEAAMAAQEAEAALEAALEGLVVEANHYRILFQTLFLAVAAQHLEQHLIILLAEMAPPEAEALVEMQTLLVNVTMTAAFMEPTEVLAVTAK